MSVNMKVTTPEGSRSEVGRVCVTRLTLEAWGTTDEPGSGWGRDVHCPFSTKLSPARRPLARSHRESPGALPKPIVITFALRRLALTECFFSAHSLEAFPRAALRRHGIAGARRRCCAGRMRSTIVVAGGNVRRVLPSYDLRELDRGAAGESHAEP